MWLRPVLLELDQFDRGAVIDDHCNSNSFGGRADLAKKSAAFERFLEVRNLKGNMGMGSYKMVNLTAGLKPHPFNSVRTRAETAHEQFQFLKMLFVGMRGCGRNAEVMKFPAAASNGFR
jgi:hypothetical protein